MTLDVPTLAEARDALIHRLGIERVVADPAAVEEIISRCGQLPLALAIVAARAGTHQELPLSEIAAELRSAHEGLDVFDDDEATGGVRTIFSWSYHLLTSQAARLFRLLPAHPGPGISVATAASLAGAPPREARQLIGELSRTRLLAEGRPGRYVLHDLVRAYARELHYDHEPSAERAAAGTRIAEHYRHTAYGAHLLLRPLVRLAPPPSPPPGVSPEKFDSEAQALAWFASEHPAIRALIGWAARDGEHKLAWHLALYAQQFYQRDGRILEWAATLQIALDAVIEAKDRVGQAYVRRSLAGAYLFLNRTESARAELEQAGRLFDELGLAAEQAHIHDNLGRILYEQGDYHEAGILAERARQSFRAAGNRKGEAAALLHLALCHAHEGRRDLAIDLLTQAVTEHREIGDLNGEGVSLDAMALTHRLFGDYPQALAYLQRAIEVYRRAGSSRANLVESLEALGDVYLAMGERGRARGVGGDAGRRRSRSAAGRGPCPRAPEVAGGHAVRDVAAISVPDVTISSLEPAVPVPTLHACLRNPVSTKYRAAASGRTPCPRRTRRRCCGSCGDLPITASRRGPRSGSLPAGLARHRLGAGEQAGASRWLFTVARRVAIDAAIMAQARPAEVALAELRPVHGGRLAKLWDPIFPPEAAIHP